MRTERFVKGQEFNHREFPIAIILNGQFEVRRSIDLIKEDTEQRVYEFKKMFPLLSFGERQTLLWNCQCTSASADVMVMELANYSQLCEFDKQLNCNVQETINTFELAVRERENEIRKTFDYKNVEESLGLSVHFKTEPLEEDHQQQRRKEPLRRITENARLLKLRQDILARAQQPRFPEAMNDVLFKLPMNRQKVSEVRRKL